MAISGGDGSIILTTKIDETGLKKGFSSMKNSVKNMSSSFAKLGGIIATVFSIRAIIQFSNEASKMASTTEASVQRLIDIYGKASIAVGDFIDQNAHALGMSRAAATEFSAVYGNLFSVWADQETNAKLTTQYLNATAVVASKTGRTMQDVQERIRSGLLGNTEAVEDLGIFVNVKTIEMTEAFQRVAQGAKWDSLSAAQQSQVRTLAILEQATKKYGTEVANTTSFTRLQYAAAFEDFKNTWGQVVNIVLIPILKIMTTIFNTLAAGLRAIAGLSGKTIEKPKVSAISGGGGGVSMPSTDTSASGGSSGTKGKSAEEEQIDAEIKAIQDKIKALQKENKQINKNDKANQKANKKQLASFDDISILQSNKLSESDALIEKNDEEIEQLQEQLELLNEKKQALQDISSASGSADGVGGVVGAGGFDFGGLESGEIDGEQYTRELALIGMVTGWALVGLGIILMFSGHPFIGIGMVASGFLLSAGAAEGGKELGKEENEKLIKIGTIIGVALIGLGVLLLFTSFWKLGLGMVASGATAIYTALALGEFSEDINKKVTDILLITGTVMLVLGTILLFVPGFGKFGLAMLAAGAAELITAAVMNANQIKQWISKNLWILVQEAGKFLFVVGIMLLFVPGMMNWGFAAMVAGLSIVGLSAIVPNWSEIKNTIMQFFTDNWGAIATVSLVLVILGVILCFAHQWLIGIGLIATGATGLYATVTPNWNEIKGKISEFFKDNWEAIATVSTALVILGVILCFAHQWLIGIGLIATGATGIYTTVVPNWGELKSKIGTFFQDNWKAIAIVSSALVVLGVILCIASLWGIGLTMIGIGAAGLYGVTSANWDGIKTTISDFVTENYNAIVGWSAALLVLGVVLLFIPGCLGVGLTLIGLSATALWGASEINSSELSGKLTTELDKVNASAETGVNKINTTLLGIKSPTGGNLNAGSFTLPKNGYARGTVVPPNRPHLAWFGDNKQEPEIVSPVSTMKQAFAEAMIEMGGSFGGGNTEVVLEIDGREFGRAVIEQGNRENRRIGTRLVIA